MPDNSSAGETTTLLREALAGSESARSRLLDRLRPRLVLWASSRLSPKTRAHAEPEDVAQEILLRIHRALDDLEDRGDRAFHAWVFQIARNCLRDLADRAGARKRQAGPLAPGSQTTPSRAAIRSENAARLMAAIDALPDDHRRVILLVKIEEREVAEVAAELDRSENAVRILYCRAMKRLAEILRKDSGSLPFDRVP